MRVDWEGRHTRLRYQMVLTSLLAYLTGSYAVDKVKVLGIIEFKESPSSELVYFSCLLFSIAFILSFVARTLAEKSQWKNDMANIKGFVNQARMQIDLALAEIPNLEEFERFFKEKINATEYEYSGQIQSDFSDIMTSEEYRKAQMSAVKANSYSSIMSNYARNFREVAPNFSHIVQQIKNSSTSSQSLMTDFDTRVSSMRKFGYSELDFGDRKVRQAPEDILNQYIMGINAIKQLRAVKFKLQSKYWKNWLAFCCEHYLFAVILPFFVSILLTLLGFLNSRENGFSIKNAIEYLL